MQVDEAVTQRGLLKGLALGSVGLAAISAGLVPLESLAKIARGGMTWRLRTPAHSPGARAYSQMAFDQAANEVVLFGGIGGDARTWAFDGTDWSLRATDGPAVRHGASFAFDPLSGGVLMFGGLGEAGFLADTWLWRKSAWQRIDNAIHPSARLGAAISYDAGLGRVVLYGGFAGDATLADTWTWTGSSWRQSEQESSPGPLACAVLVHDPSTQKLLLVGGAKSSMGVPLDVSSWTLSGDAWSQAPYQLPTRDEHSALANSGASSILAGFGGLAEGSFSDETWVRETGPSTERPIGGPQARAYASMAYEPKSAGLVLFGGQDSSGLLGDTWVLAA